MRPEPSQGGAFDIMRGSSGPDVFVFGAEVINGVQERDQITNFDASEDSIKLVDGAVIRNVVTRDTGVSIYFEGDDRDAAYVLGDVTADTLVIA